MTGTPESSGYWNDSTPAEDYPSLQSDVEVDVAIVGGGIVGMTAARLLKNQGFTVAVIEAHQVGRQATGMSTAKVTSQHGLLYHVLTEKFGEGHARLYAEAQENGLATIRALVAAHNIDCDLETIPAFIYTRDGGQLEALEKEFEVTRRIGLPASLVTEIGLPFPVSAALRFDDQAQFHPTRYIAGLAKSVHSAGCFVFENSQVTEWEPTSVKTATGEVRARHVIMATHLPPGKIGGYFTRAFPMAEPVIAARIDRYLEGMYLTGENPRYSIRTHVAANGNVYAIAAGPAFKPGSPAEEIEKFGHLEIWLETFFGIKKIEQRWVNEDYTSMDCVPFVGRSTSLGAGYLVATGFGAWGLTNGTAAAMMLTDLIMERDNPWLELFDAGRISPIEGGKQFLKESASVAATLVKGHLARRPDSASELAAGEAAIVKIDGNKKGAYRDEEGRLHLVSAVCTHMGCVVGWNEIDRTWDCACHGSRFAVDGTIIHGPAVEPLEYQIDNAT